MGVSRRVCVGEKKTVKPERWTLNFITIIHKQREKIENAPRLAESGYWYLGLNATPDLFTPHSPLEIPRLTSSVDGVS